MTPPTFTDFGKSTKDLFTKGYSTTITESITTANQIGSVFELNNQLAKGLKVTFDTKFTPVSGKREALLKTDFSGDLIRLNANLSLVGAPVLEAFAVTKLYNDWLVGGKAKYDLQANELKASSIGFLYKNSDYTLHTYTNDVKDFGASLYHKVHKNFEYGVQFMWKLQKGGDNQWIKEGDTQWGFASKYQINPDLCLRAKVDHQSQVTFAATHNLSSSVKLTFTSQFGLAGVPETSNKFGFGLEYAQ